MCRNIVRLRRADDLATESEIRNAALQFVRKVSGYRQPSKANQSVFDQAVTEIAQATEKLLGSLVVR